MKYEEPRRCNVDCRKQGTRHSTVQKEDSNRKDIVKRLILQFETHQNSDSLIKDSDITEDFNSCSGKSKEMITSIFLDCS